MKTSEFIKKFYIDPERDIKPNFKLVKSFKSETGKACYFCGDDCNNRLMPSSAWTNVQYCWKCGCINVIYFGEQMGGKRDRREFIECYSEKD